MLYIVISAVFILVAFVLVIWQIVYTVDNFRKLKGRMVRNDADIYKRLKAHASAITTLQGEVDDGAHKLDRLTGTVVPQLTSRVSTLETTASSQGSKLDLVTAQSLTNSSNLTLLESRFTGLNTSFGYMSSNLTGLRSNQQVQFGALSQSYSSLSNAVSAGFTTSSNSFISMSNLAYQLSSTLTTSYLPRINALESNSVGHSMRIGALEGGLGSNATRLGAVEGTVGGFTTRFATVESNVGSNTIRIGALESRLMAAAPAPAPSVTSNVI